MNKKKVKKQMGISVDFTVYKHKGQITQKQCWDFVDAFVDLVEKYGWYCGGGAHLVNMNED